MTNSSSSPSQPINQTQIAESEQNAQPTHSIDPKRFLPRTKVDSGLQERLVEGIRDIISGLQEDGASLDPELFLSSISEDFPPHLFFVKQVQECSNIYNNMKRYLLEIGVKLFPMSSLTYTEKTKTTPINNFTLRKGYY